MSPVAIIIIAFGALIVLTRGPLVFTPTQVRDYYLRLFNTDTRMRLLGLSFALIGAGAAWAVRAETGTASDIIYAFGVFLLAITAFFFIPFAKAARRLATLIWKAFGTATLRAIGAASVAAGIALVYYGFSM